MRKFYNLLLVSLFCLIGLEANAFTLFVDIDNTANLSEVATYYSGKKTPLNLAEEMPLTAEFPDDEGMKSLYVTPKSGCYITRFLVKDEDGNVLSDKKGAWKSMQLVQVLPAYDYGTLYIETSATRPTDAKMTVNLNGSPSNVSLYLGGSRSVNLKRGSQEIEFSSSSEGTVYLMPVGVTKFYKVTHNGDEVEARGTSDESGNISYQYTLSVKNGSEINIDVDYPEVYCNCSISVGEGMEDFIQEVTVGGVPVADWKEFTAKMGSKLVIMANTNDYDLETFTVNGRASSFTVGVWDMIVEDKDVDIRMEGSLIQRPYTAKFITYNWMQIGTENFGSYDLRRADNKAVILNNGETIVAFNEKETPFVFEIFGDKVMEAVAVAINGEPVYAPAASSRYELHIKDGDIVQIGLATELPDLAAVAINDVQTSRLNAADYKFNLAGQKVSSGYKGIVIKNGKKVVL